ncbi:MAG: phosphopyruvate hydratase [Pseudomonadota bacterium]|nr:phosphopyruvate hydratase [Pseudomonadota bacterium]
MSSNILKIWGREILDSRGTPTVEVEVTLKNGILTRAAVPSGASTGTHEACELRDNDKKRYLGKGVLIAVKSVNETIAPKLIGFDPSKQSEIDELMLKLDGTENKMKLGANAILGVSLAVARAAAQDRGLPLYQYLGARDHYKIPVPLMNILNGGAHANNGLNVQEFMIVPLVGGSFRESLRAGAEVFQALKKILNKKGHSTAVGDEGGFAPRLKANREALELISEAITESGYQLGRDIYIALDVAASEFYKEGAYNWEGNRLNYEQMAEVYADWAKDFPILSIEDGFSEDDWDGWISFTKSHGDKIQIVGDDLFVTNPKRLLEGIKRRAANALLVKVNQIGTLSETANAVKLAKESDFHTIMSHRSGETEDNIIADLAVAMGCEQIKTGSLSRSDRIAKYNQLLRIEETLGSKAQYWGKDAF